jgi:hypothetical protein
MAEPLYDLSHCGDAIVHQLEDPSTYPPGCACPDPVLLARSQGPGQALHIDRADLTELRCTPYLLDAHGGLLGVITEVVLNPYPAKVGLGMPVGVEVVDGVADPAF